MFASLVGDGRFATLPPLPAGYLKGTMVVRVPIEEAVGKVNDQVDTADGPDGLWSGLLPVSAGFGPPAPDGRTLREGTATPADLDSYRRGRR